MRVDCARAAARMAGLCCAWLAVAGTAAEGQGRTGEVAGRVLAEGAPVPAALVAVRGTSVRVLADGRGAYRIERLPAGTHTVVASALGHETRDTTITVPEGGTVIADFALAPAAVRLDPITVTGTMKRTIVSESAVKVEVVPASVLQRTVTNNLMESIRFVNGLYQQVDCGVCYTNNIRINGMEGPYTAVLIDGMPIMSSLASVYGLNGINPSMVERIEIIKGPSSTLYGSEAMAGVINVITKEPRFAPRLLLDSYVTTHGESNVDVAAAPASGALAALFSGSFAYNGRFIDGNGDGFTDLPLNRRGSLFGRMDYVREGRRVFGLTAKGYFEDRFGGVQQWTRADRGSAEVYGESIVTKRVEVLGSYLLPRTAERLRLDFSYAWHDQDSYYGDAAFAARQTTLFGNLVWHPEAGALHDVLVGVSGRYQAYDDNTPATVLEDRRFIPGVFVQDEWSVAPDWKLLGGVRLDHHAEHGAIVAPRANVKWEPLPRTAVRLNAGTGFRVVNLFTEDHAALTGARDVVIAEALRPERSVSATLNVNQIVEWGPSPMMIDLDLFITRFSNKITPDYDTDPGLILYRNLPGHAVSRGVSLSLNQNVAFERLLYTVGVTWQDVYAVRAGDRQRELFAPRFQGVLSTTYNFARVPIRLDYSGSLTGPMRLPAYDEPHARPTRSPAYTLHNVQGTWRSSRGIEIYGAIQNLLDYTQPSPLVDPGDPFGDDFDTAYVYGPLQGRRLLLGARYGVGR